MTEEVREEAAEDVTLLELRQAQLELHQALVASPSTLHLPFLAR